MCHALQASSRACVLRHVCACWVGSRLENAVLQPRPVGIWMALSRASASPAAVRNTQLLVAKVAGKHMHFTVGQTLPFAARFKAASDGIYSFFQHMASFLTGSFTCSV